MPDGPIRVIRVTRNMLAIHWSPPYDDGGYPIERYIVEKTEASRSRWTQVRQLSVLAGRVVSVLGSGAEGPGFRSQPRRCRVTVLGKLFTPIVPLFTKQRNW